MTQTNTKRYFLALDPAPSLHSLCQSARLRLQTNLAYAFNRLKAPVHLTIAPPFDMDDDGICRLGRHIELLAERSVAHGVQARSFKIAALDGGRLVFLIEDEEIAAVVGAVAEALQCFALPQGRRSGAGPHVALGTLEDPAVAPLALGELEGLSLPPGGVGFSDLLLYERVEDRWAEARRFALKPAAA